MEIDTVVQNFSLRLEIMHKNNAWCKIQACGARYGKSSSLKKHIFDKHNTGVGPTAVSNPSKIPKTHPAYEDLKCTPGSDFPSDAEVLKQMELEVERTLIQGVLAAGGIQWIFCKYG